MKTVSLNCNHCGAPLQVPEDARFVTCRFCEQSLQIEQNDSVRSTQLLKQISDQTETLADELHELKQLAKIEELDRRWEQTQKQFLNKNASELKQTPSKEGSILGGVIALMFGTTWLAIISMMKQIAGFGGILTLFQLIGMVMMVGAIASSVRSYNRADMLETEAKRYRRERKRLTKKHEL